MHVHFSVKSQLSLIKGSNKGMDLNKKHCFLFYAFCFLLIAFCLHTIQNLALKAAHRRERGLSNRSVLRRRVLTVLSPHENSAQVVIVTFVGNTLVGNTLVGSSTSISTTLLCG